MPRSFAERWSRGTRRAKARKALKRFLELRGAAVLPREFFAAADDRSFRGAIAALEAARASGRRFASDEELLAFAASATLSKDLLHNEPASSTDPHEMLELIELQEAASVAPIEVASKIVPDEEIRGLFSADELQALRGSVGDLAELAMLPADLLRRDQQIARLLSLRLFGGCSLEQIAAMDNRSVAEIRRQWEAARRWLDAQAHEQPFVERAAILDVFDRQVLRAINEDLHLIKALEWRTFERIIAGVLQDIGFEVELCQGTKDGGVDIIALRRDTAFGEQKYLVQAKRWSEPVGVEPVRQLMFLKSHYRASKVCVATSTFTQGALQLADEYRWELELRDFDRLKEWIDAAVGARE